MKYDIVTGLARSGTSAMMGCLREAGIPLAGYRYPIVLAFNKDDKNPLCGGAEKPIDPNETRKNEKGFWEVSEVIKSGLKKDTYSGSAIKVPCAAFVRSNPRYMRKVIMMVRPPRAVMTSMLRDVRNANAWGAQNVYREMALRQILTVKLIHKYRLPYEMIPYTELIEYPVDMLTCVCKALGRGDPKWGAKYIEKKYRRSNKKLDTTECMELELNEWIYERLSENHIDDILQYDARPLMKECREAARKLDGFKKGPEVVKKINIG